MKKVQLGLKPVLALILASMFLTSVLWYVFAQTPSETFWIAGGVYPGAPSYTIWREGSNYFAKDDNGRLEYATSNFTEIMESCANNLIGGSPVANRGGAIFLKAGTYSYTTGISILLQEASNIPRPLMIYGEGESTVLQFTGSGFALTINTVYATYEWVKLANFKIDGVTKTSGRHGLSLINIGRKVVVNHIKLYRFDVGFNITTLNQLYVYNTKIVSVDIGIQSLDGSSNELSFINCDVINSTESSADMHGGSQIVFDHCTFNPGAGVGLTLNGTWLGAKLQNTRFEPNDNINYSLVICDNFYASFGVLVSDCYWNGANKANYAVFLDGVRDIHFDTPVSRNHNESFICLANKYTDLLITNPRILDPFLLDSHVPLTAFQNRIAGRVVEPRRTGLIVLTSQNVTEGDVIYQTTSKGLWSTTTTANQNLTSVVMWDSIDASKPTVICIEGISPINNATAVSMGDTMVSHNVATQATVDNGETNPQTIIGYVVATSGDVGDDFVYVRVLSK